MEKTITLKEKADESLSRVKWLRGNEKLGITIVSLGHRNAHFSPEPISLPKESKTPLHSPLRWLWPYD